MTRFELYDIALRYKKAKLWKKISGDQMFALKLANGEIGYINVLGNDDLYFAMVLYIGDDGIQDYLRINSQGSVERSNFRTEFEFYEFMNSQSCLQLVFDSKDSLDREEERVVRQYAADRGIRFTGKNAYPRFIKFQKYRMPWGIAQKKEMRQLGDAAEACIQLAEQLKGIKPADLGIGSESTPGTQIPLFALRGGVLTAIDTITLPEIRKNDFPYIKAGNDFDVAIVKRLPHNGIWEAEYIRSPQPFTEGKGAPMYPLIPVIANAEDWKLANIEPQPDGDERPEKLLAAYAAFWKEVGEAPAEIRCRDKRTYAILKDFASRSGTMLHFYDGPMPALEDAEDFFLNEVFGDSDENLSEEEIVETIEYLLSLPRKELKEIPGEIWFEILRLSDMGLIPQYMQKKFDRLIHLVED